jgi:hypothetical protein
MTNVGTSIHLVNDQASMGYVSRVEDQPSAPIALTSPVEPVSVPVRLVTPPLTESSITHPILCPGCSRFVLPYEKHTYGGFAAISSIGLCFVTPLLALLPCCCSTFKDIIYTCPNCRTRLSHYKKIPL